MIPIAFRACVLSCLLASSAVAQSPAQAVPPVDLDAYLRRDTFSEIEISPTGEYFAATVPLEDRTILAVIRRSDKQATAKIHVGEDTVILDVWWVNDNRVLASVAEKRGRNDQPSLTGEIIAIDVDGERGKWLTSRESYTFALMHDDLPDDDRNVLIASLSHGDNYETLLEKMNV